MSWSKSEIIVLPIAFAVCLVLSLISYFCFRRKQGIVKTLPLILITSVMLILECVKQVRSIIEGYSLWNIPLHFCSLFLYFYPLAVFTKGKVCQFGKTMSLVCSLMFFALFYINPSSIINDSCSNILGSFSSFHTFVYHHLIIVFLLTSLMLNFYEYKKENFTYVLWGFSVYASVGILLSQILKVNFCNLLESNIPFMETLRVNAGQLVYLVVMYVFALACGCLIILVQKILKKIKDKKEAKKWMR